MDAADAVTVMEIERDCGQIGAGEPGGSGMRTRQRAGPNWKSGLLLEDPAAAEFLDLKVCAPILQKLNRPSVAFANREGSLDAPLCIHLLAFLGTPELLARG